MTTSHKKSQKTKDKTASKPALPVLRLYNNGFAKLSPAGQRGIIEAHRAHNAAVATLPDDGKLGPSAKNKYLWVGTSLEAKVKKQGTSDLLFSLRTLLTTIQRKQSTCSSSSSSHGTNKNSNRQKKKVTPAPTRAPTNMLLLQTLSASRTTTCKVLQKARPNRGAQLESSLRMRTLKVRTSPFG